MSLKIDVSLRHDIICEKTRSPGEIRKELAIQLRSWRKFRETFEYHIAEIAMIRIRILKWVLQHDITPKAYYKKQYNRKWPE